MFDKFQHQVWVTPVREGENYPGGDFPNQSPSLEGLPKWTEQDRSLVGEQLSVWHVFGVTHNPRPGLQSTTLSLFLQSFPLIIMILVDNNNNIINNNYTYCHNY